MNHDPIRRYLSELRSRLRVDAAAQRDIVAERSDHLREAVRRETATGRIHEEAVVTVLARFESVGEIAGRMTTRHNRGRGSHARARPAPRGPGPAYAAISVVALVLLATFALTQRATPPPTIAEFAPQAVEQLADAATDAAGSGATTTPESSDADHEPAGDDARGTVDVARVRQCVGDPPRQIEDPQSPPCVPYWDGDNGGATWRGVTRDEIRISAPAHDSQLHPLLERFFNERFEFYGRKVRFLANNGWSSQDPQVQHAGAVNADEAQQVFASSQNEGDGGVHYHLELARRRVVSAAGHPPFMESVLARHRPYLWQYPLAIDRMFAGLGGMACAQLTGRNAEHGGPDVALSRRVFGVVVAKYIREHEISSTALREKLVSCGTPVAAEFHWEGNVIDPARGTNVVVQMRNRGVTSIACLCPVMMFGMSMQRAATTQGYTPEWLMTTYAWNDFNYAARVFLSPEQAEHTFGLSYIPKQVRPADTPVVWALEDVGWQYGTSRTSGQMFQWGIEYKVLLLLASGIQMAGPRLTPETFELGLHRTRFPNPPHPIMQGNVGFDDADHTMTDDAAQIWWSPVARGPYDDDVGGSYCYVDGGARRRPETFPEQDPYFNGPCDTGA